MEKSLHSPFMNRLSQAGILCVAMGAVMLFLGLFPFAADLDTTPGVGISQLTALLTGFLLLVLGAYTVVYSLLHIGRPRTLLRDFAVRLGMTGLVVSMTSALADVLGFGSHVGGTLFGWVQAGGMLIGFGLSALGVAIYGLSARRH